jgi:undecaprenyl diphosphate synthase
MKYPKHLAIIPDGCRRWATEKGLPPWEGHKKGIQVLEKLLRWGIINLPIKYHTAYGLSLENFSRPKAQLDALSVLYPKYFIKLSKDKDIHENEVHLDIIGREDILPKKMLNAIKIARNATKDYTNKYLIIALAYSGRAEIVDAAKKLAKTGKEITEKSMSKSMYANIPDPDLVIRTAERRMSNFLLWQTAYTEFYIVDKFWPDFTKEDYIDAFKEFDKRHRRYGK